ncbi:hypothetical protein D3C72_1929860 [compost metagenome]
MFEIGLVELARCENADAAAVAPGIGEQGVAEAAEEAGQAVDVHFRIDVGKCAGGGDTVFQREAGAGRRLGPIAQHPPGPIGAAAKLEGAEMQVMAAHGLDAHHRAEKFAIARDQFGRQQALLHEAVVAIDFGDDGFEQFGALDEAGADARPVGLADQQRHMG